MTRFLACLLTACRDAATALDHRLANRYAAMGEDDDA